MGGSPIVTHGLKGRKQSPEHIAKRLAALRSNPNWMKHCKERAIAMGLSQLGSKHSEAHKQAISTAMIGKRNSLGTKRSLAYRKNLSDYWTRNKTLHNHYKDGRYIERASERIVAMQGLEYRLWREAVFTRDNFTCVRCGTYGGTIQADHIKTWAEYPDLRYAIDNGRTLCVPCHRSRRKWEEVPN